MQLVRVQQNGQPVKGYLEGNMLFLDNGEKISTEEAQFLAPVQPTKIIAMHLNFPSRIEAFGAKMPRWPSYFMKPVSSLAGHRAEVCKPRGTRYLNYEGAIALVIGNHSHNEVPQAV